MKSRYRIGNWPDVENPRLYNEKILWINLNVRPSIFSILVDKVRIREYVADKVGIKYLNEIYGVWEHAEDIDFDALPERFVLKANHGSGWNIICPDKTRLDLSDTRKKLNRWIGRNYYDYTKEWAYKNVPPRILCERYLSSTEEITPHDYKISCFNGIPRYIQVDVDRYGNHRRSYYTTDWRLMPITGGKKLADPLKRPKNLEEMIRISGVLSKGFPFARIDLYNIDGEIIFGEFTLYCGGGTEQFDNESENILFGDWIDLKQINIPGYSRLEG